MKEAAKMSTVEDTGMKFIGEGFLCDRERLSEDPREVLHAVRAIVVAFFLGPTEIAKNLTPITNFDKIYRFAYIYQVPGTHLHRVPQGYTKSKTIDDPLLCLVPDRVHRYAESISTSIVPASSVILWWMLCHLFLTSRLLFGLLCTGYAVAPEVGVHDTSAKLLVHFRLVY